MPEDIDAYQLGAFLPPNKQEMLDVLALNYTTQQLKTIFANSLQRKKRNYQRMLGYTTLDQCRRSYLLEFFGEIPDKPKNCCDIDSNLSNISKFNRKKVKRKLTYTEKLENLFKVE